MGIALVISLWIVAQLASQLASQPYVLYHGERWPSEKAGELWCHDLARPAIRCFDSLDELRRDIEVNFPWKLGSFDDLVNMTPGP
jgi:hypothetical protein